MGVVTEFRSAYMRYTVALLIVILAACSGNSTPTQAPTVKVLGNSSGVALQIAHDQGFFNGVNVEVTRAGYDEQNSIFFSGGYLVNFGMAPWEVADFVSQGEKIKYFSPNGSNFLWAGVIVSTKNADKYKTIKDLVGKKLGIPGFGTGTYAAFRVLVNERYGIQDPAKSFQIVEADAGALFALVEKGDLDAVLNYDEQTLVALAQPDKFTVTLSLSKEWQAETGQPMVIGGLEAKTSWLDTNASVAKAIVQGVNKGVQWMREHPSDLTKGGKYADWFDAAGVLADPQIEKAVLDKVHAGEWYSSGDFYTQAWIDSQYKFIKSGLGVVIKQLPSQDDIFYPPDKLK